MLVLYQCHIVRCNAICLYCIKLIIKFSFFRHDCEADFIGLYLSASAGYDPREAPKILEKMDKFLSKNPSRLSPEWRAEYLSMREVMEVPLAIYLRGCLNIKT